MSESVQLYPPASPEYVAGTSPDNSSGTQEPAFVAKPATAAEVSAVVVEAARRGLQIMPQATGHGAGGHVGNNTIIIDTSGLRELTIDPDARTASAGAGLTWGEINPKAEVHGLMGLAGSSPTVGIGGFTFGGGFGWFTRPFGAASSALRSVEYVDGKGNLRRATEDAVDPMDRDALWAFRGGGGVGIATHLHFDLVPINDLHAGYLLWPIEALDVVVQAWATALPEVGATVATSIAVLHTPPAPSFPKELQGVPVVHLAVASSDGEAGALPLLDAVRRVIAPTVDTWGPTDASGLATIHLDPPIAVPAIGLARWLGPDTGQVAADILRTAAPAESALAMIEIRSLDNEAPTRDGAQTAIQGPFVVHAVGALIGQNTREHINKAFSTVRRAAATVDLGLSLGSWAEGSDSVPDALPEGVRQRVDHIADTVDPDRVISRSRYLG